MRFLILIISLIFLSWCFGWWYEKKEISFEDKFTMNINESFDNVWKWQFDWQQISKKIIKAFLEREQDSDFNDNFIVTKREIKTEVTPEVFSEWNYKNIQRQITWLRNISWLRKHEFTCNWKNIIWYYSMFNVHQSIFDEDTKYYLLQYYFIYNDRWYILSFSSSDDRYDEFIESIESISCK